MLVSFTSAVRARSPADDLTGRSAPRRRHRRSPGNDEVSLGRGPGNDLVIGGRGNDDLRGGIQNDRVFGGLGDDTVNGNAGNDVLVGGPGVDIIQGGLGNDSLGAVDGIAETVNCSGSSSVRASIASGLDP